jgi:hypothetical protein
VSAQTLLWDSYTGKVYPYLGISAFPSMHNALAALLALVAWRMHRVLGIMMTIFAGLILLGSVHLAWHYAVDSYAGILIAMSCHGGSPGGWRDGTCASARPAVPRRVGTPCPLTHPLPG